MSKGSYEASLARMRAGGITLKTRPCHSEGELDGEARGIGSAGLAVHVAALEHWHVALKLLRWQKDLGRTPCVCMARETMSGPFDFAPMTDYGNTFWRRSAQGDRLENFL
jgi:hypothetical protein